MTGAPYNRADRAAEGTPVIDILICRNDNGAVGGAAHRATERLFGGKR